MGNTNRYERFAGAKWVNDVNGAMQTLTTLMEVNDGKFKSEKQSAFFMKNIGMTYEECYDENVFEGWLADFAIAHGIQKGQKVFWATRATSWGKTITGTRYNDYIVMFDKYGVVKCWKQTKRDGYKLLWERQWHPEPEKEPEQPAEPESQWVGTVGEKIEITAKLIHKKWFKSNYGQYIGLHVFKMNGNILKAFYGGKVMMKKGHRYNFKAEVKAHEEYNGEKQTVITRLTGIKEIE